MKYDFIDLKEDLCIGHEVEFIYNGNRYSISNNENGCHLTKYGDENYQTFVNHEELIEKGTIENKNIETIWDYVIIVNVF